MEGTSVSETGPFVALDFTAVHPVAGGGHTYARMLSRHLPAAGITPLCITRRNTDRAEWDGNPILAVAPTMRPLRLAWEQTSLLRTLYRSPGGPDIAVLHSIHYTMPEHPTRVSGLARVVTIHDLTFFTNPSAHTRSKRLLFRRAIAVAAQQADQLICVSEATATELLAHVEVRAPIEVIPHGIDQARFAANEPRPGHDAATLVELGIDGPYVLHLGTIEPRKNVGRLIEAVALMNARTGIDVQLVLAGGAWPGAREALPAPDGLRIQHLGIVSDAVVPALLRRADAVAYPSFAEGFGLPAVEALSCGAPLVTSRGSVMEQLVGEGAVLADPESVDDLARAVHAAVLGDGPARSDRLRVASRYDATLAATRHAELYRRLG